MDKVFLIAVTLMVTFSVTFARDPDALPRDYQYGENQTVGGSKQWTGADTFVLCGVAVMAAMVFALPEIFDGESINSYTLPRLSDENRQILIQLNNPTVVFPDCGWQDFKARALLSSLPILNWGSYGIIMGAPSGVTSDCGSRYKFPTRRMSWSR